MFKKIPILCISMALLLTGCFSDPAKSTIPKPTEIVVANEVINQPSEPTDSAPKPVEEPKEEIPPVLTESPPNVNLEGNGRLVVEFIDVGQGDSVLILTPSGKSILIDSGDRGNAGIIGGRMKANNVSTLNAVIATHPHADHIGSMADILSTYKVESLYMPNATSTSKTFENLLYTIQSKGIQIDIATKGKTVPLEDGLSLEFLAPTKDWGSNTNNFSAVLMLRYGKTSFLFTGDMESDAEKTISSLGIDVDVLKVGHHGSDTSSSLSFLKAVTPDISIISVGAGNKYGHPAPQVIERLQSMGSKVYRTDESGTIRVESDGIIVSVVDAKPSAPVVVAPAPKPVPAPTPKPTPDPAPTPAPQPKPEEPQNSVSNEKVVVFKTKTGSKYHMDGCSALRSRIETTVGKAKAIGLEPCSICNPPN